MTSHRHPGRSGTIQLASGSRADAGPTSEAGWQWASGNTSTCSTSPRCRRAGTTSSRTCPRPPPPPLHPGTHQPVGPDDLAPLFPMDLILQEVSDRAVHPDPGRGPGHLPALAPVAAVPGAPAGAGARHPGPDLLQVRGCLTGRLAQAQHRGAAGVLQRQGRRQEADHRDRRRPVGHRAGLRLLAVRRGMRGLAGRRVLRREALPAHPDRDLRRHRAPLAVAADLRPAASFPADHPGSLGIAISEAVEVAASGSGHQVRAGLGAQPRPAAPDDHRRGGAAAAGAWPARPAPTWWSAAPAADPTSAGWRSRSSGRSSPAGRTRRSARSNRRPARR